MYFPYLRTKQFELIALRELCPIFQSSANKLSPVLEPVNKLEKGMLATFQKTLKELSSAKVNFTIIINPDVGYYSKKFDDQKEIVSFINENLRDYSNFQVGIIVVSEDQLKSISSSLLDKIGINYAGLTFIHKNKVNDIVVFDALFDKNKLRYNLIDTNKHKRYNRNFENNILWENPFIPQAKNADYSQNPSEFFSEEFRFYKTEGYIGISDFQTIGNNYMDGGWQPFAVAIHITHIKDGHLQVEHFVSDSNFDTTDVAGKFSEALKKLVAWHSKTNTLKTKAIDEFIRLDSTGSYPGLGIIKKLSIMNHIELVISLI